MVGIDIHAYLYVGFGQALRQHALPAGFVDGVAQVEDLGCCQRWQHQCAEADAAGNEGSAFHDISRMLKPMLTAGRAGGHSPLELAGGGVGIRRFFARKKSAKKYTAIQYMQGVPLNT